jgi:hypothetical protein
LLIEGPGPWEKAPRYSTNPTASNTIAAMNTPQTSRKATAAGYQAPAAASCRRPISAGSRRGAARRLVTAYHARLVSPPEREGFVPRAGRPPLPCWRGSSCATGNTSD